MIAFYNRRPWYWSTIDALRDLFSSGSTRLKRIDNALHAVHNFDVYR